MVDNVAPMQTWEALKADTQAQLVDVRTETEWNTIGVPDLGESGKTLALVAWQLPPLMQKNGKFLEQMREAGIKPEHHIYFLCRSGVRSLAAADAARQAGFPHVYNVADGFEGPPDGSGQRGTIAGWQADRLPWKKR